MLRQLFSLRATHRLVGIISGLLIGTTFGLHPARGQTTSNWNSGNGTWSTSGNWSAGVPANGGGNYYNAVINGSGSDIVTFDASGTRINSLTLGSGETLQDNGAAPALTIGDPAFPAAASLTYNGTINWGSGAKLTLDITSGNGTIQNYLGGNLNLTASTLTLNDSGHSNSLSVSGAGTITMSGAAITGNNGTETLINASTIQGSGTISNLTLVNTGTINANATSALTIAPSSGGFTNNGRVNVTGAGGMAVNGQLTNGSSGTLIVTGGSTLSVQNSLNDQGFFSVHDGGVVTVGQDFTNNYFVFVGGSGTNSLTIGGTLHNVDSSGNLTGDWNLQNGKVFYDGSGGVNGNQDITTIASGASLALNGTSSSTAGFFGKTNPGYNHLALSAVNGTLVLAGGLSLATPGDFTNSGTVELENSSGLTVGGAFHNVDSSGNLTGFWDIQNGSVQYDGTGGVNGNQDITNVAGLLILTGPGGFYGKTNPSYNHLALSTVNGTFEVFGGAAYTTPGNFLNNGAVGVYGSLTIGGTLQNVDTSGNLTGSWYLGVFGGSGNVYYDGTGGVNGSQDITTIASGARLVFEGQGGFFGKTNPSYNHLQLATNSGFLSMQNGMNLVTPGNFTNNGMMDLFGGNGTTAGLTVGGTFVNAATGSISLVGSTALSSTGGFTNNGTLTASSGTATVSGALVNATTGSISLQSGGSLSTTGNFTNNGAVTATSGGSVTVGGALVNATTGNISLQNGGTLSTTGDFTNSGTVNILDVGRVDSSGTLTVGGVFHSVDTSGNLTGKWVLGGQVYYDGTGGIGGTQNISTIAKGASLTLDGTDHVLFGNPNAPGFFGKTNPSLNHLASLATVKGTFGLQNGATFTTTTNFNNSGTVSILDVGLVGSSGALTVGGALFGVTTAGSLSGNWVIGGQVYYDGTGGIGGTQNITTIAKAASLTLDGTDASTATPGFFGKTNPSLNHLAPLATIAGTFGLQNGAKFTTAGNLTNSGTVRISTGTVLTSGGPGVYTQSGTRAKTTVDGSLTAAGGININGGSVFGNNGTLAGNVSSSGTMNVGDAIKQAGLLSISGSYTQNSAGALNIDIGGMTAATQYDQLDITGAASFSGILNLDRISHFTPTIGESFDIMNFGTFTGTFITVNGTSISANEHFSVVYNPTNVMLDVVSGKSLLASSLANTGEAGAPSSTPEPSSLFLLGSGLASAALLGYRRWKVGQA